MSNYDALTGLEMQVKRPTENIPFTFIFTNMTTGETISAVDSVIQENRGSIPDSVDVLISSITNDSNAQGQCWLASGTDEEYYCVTMTVTTSIGATRTCSGVLNVKEACNN